jgi:predicted nucleic acid-binding protein
MNVDYFIDTNVLVHAYDSDQSRKHSIARNILSDVWNEKIKIAISIQVLQEFYSVMTRRGGDVRYYKKLAEDMLSWMVVDNTGSLFRRALPIHHKLGTSFYDANIIAAAQVAGAKEIWSEDFNTGQDYGGVIAVNPFIEGKL